MSETSEGKNSPPAQTEEAKKKLREKVETLLSKDPFKSEGSVSLNKTRLQYKTVAEFIPVKSCALDETRGEPEAAIFTTSYFAVGGPAKKRPVCFVLNGGPGSTSVWLHLGALGPKRIVVPDDGSAPRPPYEVSDNPYSWLEHFDLVFIDPPHTGYSLTASEEARKKILSVDGDAEALVDCIRTWLSRHKRWGAELFLTGESYGTTRGAIIADKLQENGVTLSGIILVSCAMDFQSLVFSPRNDLPYALFLPAYACVAQYHGKLNAKVADSPAAARAAAEAFVAEDYLNALHAGARLSKSVRSKVASRMSELTGLPESLIEEKNLRISDTTFFFDLLRNESKIVGRLDARATSPMAASRTREWEFDPGMESIMAPYTMAAQAYMNEQLGIDMDERFDIYSSEVNKQWTYTRGEDKGNSYTCTSPDLSRAMRRNPHMKVLVASAYYDLGTPYSASDWSLAQLDAPPDVLKRIQHEYFEAGHMMYTREDDLRKLKAKLADWLKH